MKKIFFVSFFFFSPMKFINKILVVYFFIYDKLFIFNVFDNIYYVTQINVKLDKLVNKFFFFFLGEFLYAVNLWGPKANKEVYINMHIHNIQPKTTYIRTRPCAGIDLKLILWRLVNVIFFMLHIPHSFPIFGSLCTEFLIFWSVLGEWCLSQIIPKLSHDKICLVTNY